MKRYFVGKKLDSVVRVVFQSGSTPSQSSHGHIYSSVIGPFKTKRAAQFTAMFGLNNPHIQTVSDAERITKAV